MGFLSGLGRISGLPAPSGAKIPASPRMAFSFDYYDCWYASKMFQIKGEAITKFLILQEAYLVTAKDRERLLDELVTCQYQRQEYYQRFRDITDGVIWG